MAIAHQQPDPSQDNQVAIESLWAELRQEIDKQRVLESNSLRHGGHPPVDRGVQRRIMSQFPDRLGKPESAHLLTLRIARIKRALRTLGVTDAEIDQFVTGQ